MKNKTKTKEVWTCDYCGQEFNTKKEADGHEVNCDKNKNSLEKKAKTQCIVLGIFLFFLLFIKSGLNIPSTVGGYIGVIIISSILSWIYRKIIKKERTPSQITRIMFIFAYISVFITMFNEYFGIYLYQY